MDVENSASAGQRVNASVSVQIWERARQQLEIPPGRAGAVALGGELSLWRHVNTTRKTSSRV